MNKYLLEISIRARNATPKAWAIAKASSLFWRQNSYLRQVGFFRSLGSGIACDSDGNRIPWINYPMIDFLSDRLQFVRRCFEFGSGASTEYFASRGIKVVACEHDPVWYREVRGRLDSKIELLKVEADDADSYLAGFLASNGPFDLITVDGLFRCECAHAAFEAMGSRTVVMLDDSQLDEHRSIHEEAQSRGLRSIRISGMKPLVTFKSETTLFYGPENCLGI